MDHNEKSHGGDYTPGARIVPPASMPQPQPQAPRPHPQFNQSLPRPLPAQDYPPRIQYPHAPNPQYHSQSHGYYDRPRIVEQEIPQNDHQEQSALPVQRSIGKPVYGPQNISDSDIETPSGGSRRMNAPRNNTLLSNSSNLGFREVAMPLLSTKNVFLNATRFRWKRPHHYQVAAYYYQNGQDGPYRHRDFAGRVMEGPRYDRYIHHSDGRLRKLIVACTDDIFGAPGTSTWRRTYIRNQAGLRVRAATWILDYDEHPNSWGEWGLQLLRTVPAAVAMIFLVFATGKGLRTQFGGNYAPIPYNFYGDAKVWSNQLENRRSTALTHNNTQVYRTLKPRHICFLKEPGSKELHGVDVRSLADWEDTDGKGKSLSYIFVAYTATQFPHGSRAAMEALHTIAETAARAAGVLGYWVAASCMRDAQELEADVYRIADVLRGADSMVIAVGNPHSGATRRNTSELLREWGERMWTFPEVLLSPGKTIAVYTKGKELSRPLIISKNQFAGSVWSDAEISRQLIDSYLGNLGLSRLELAVLALSCLYSRNTTQYLAGDQAYALMGLLRLKPEIDKTDTQFQAFARLSLANDSDRLLERYIATLPLSIDQPWYSMDDVYQCKLWDITPTCQVAAICDDDTVIIDGAYGASIRWKSFFRVDYTTKLSLGRRIAVQLMHIQGYFLLIAIILFACGAPATGSSSSSSSYYYGSYYTSYSDLSGLYIFGAIFLIIYIWIMLKTPQLIRKAYGGKFWDVQAAMFGVEGYINTATAERAIFGGSFGRMSWSPNGSPLSRTQISENGERIAVNPTTDPEVAEKVRRAKDAKPGEMRIFTLVDTFNMQLTLFEAINPPVCLFFCASEGGMQRVLGCSYDWTTQTMYRETVLRMPTPSLDRANRVPRFRLGIRRPQWPAYAANAATSV